MALRSAPLKEGVDDRSDEKEDGSMTGVVSVANNDTDAPESVFALKNKSTLAINNNRKDHLEFTGIDFDNESSIEKSFCTSMICFFAYFLYRWLSVLSTSVFARRFLGSAWRILHVDFRVSSDLLLVHHHPRMRRHLNTNPMIRLWLITKLKWPIPCGFCDAFSSSSSVALFASER